MNRETVVAVVLGVLLGAGLGIFVLFQTNKGDQAKVIPVKQDQTSHQVREATKKPVEQSFKLESPQSMSVTPEKSIQLQGKAAKGSLIILQSAVANVTFKTTSDTFTSSFPLALGENSIHITVYAPNSAAQESDLTIYSVEE